MGQTEAVHLVLDQIDSRSGGLTDPLTGLGNRSRMREKVRLLVSERASDPAPFTIGIANLDAFKPINDLFGTWAGDEILCQVAHRLKACMPEGALVTRHGGDEFAFVLPLIFERLGAEAFAQIIREVLSAPYDLSGRKVRLSASFGFAIHPFSGEGFDALLKSAETALYQSKRRGRGQITLYSEALAEEMLRSTQLEQALRDAIIADAIDVHFQPIVSLQDESVVGFEALARWTDTELGPVSPGQFVPLAEERGFIDALSEALLRKAAEAALYWPQDVFLSFNISSVQLMDPGTASSILNILYRAGLDPRRLVVEITETAVVTSAEAAQKIIHELKTAGVRISLDDFGTGQSSLGRLQEFAFDKVKIDRVFVSRMSAEPGVKHIVRAILTMCKGLGLEVVAEGIENETEAMKLKSMGCSMAQGFYFGRPADATAALKTLERSGLNKAV